MRVQFAQSSHGLFAGRNVHQQRQRPPAVPCPHCHEPQQGAGYFGNRPGASHGFDGVPADPEMFTPPQCIVHVSLPETYLAACNELRPAVVEEDPSGGAYRPNVPRRQDVQLLRVLHLKERIRVGQVVLRCNPEGTPYVQAKHPPQCGEALPCRLGSGFQFVRPVARREQAEC